MRAEAEGGVHLNKRAYGYRLLSFFFLSKTTIRKKSSVFGLLSTAFRIAAMGHSMISTAIQLLIMVGVWSTMLLTFCHRSTYEETSFWVSPGVYVYLSSIEIERPLANIIPHPQNLWKRSRNSNLIGNKNLFNCHIVSYIRLFLVIGRRIRSNIWTVANSAMNSSRVANDWLQGPYSELGLTLKSLWFQSSFRAVSEQFQSSFRAVFLWFSYGKSCNPKSRFNIKPSWE